jgi:hypothetical protein
VRAVPARLNIVAVLLKGEVKVKVKVETAFTNSRPGIASHVGTYEAML